MKSGSLSLLESSGPVQACNGIALQLRRALLQHFKGRTRLERLLLIPTLRYGTERDEVAVKDLTQDGHYTTQYPDGKQ